MEKIIVSSLLILAILLIRAVFQGRISPLWQYSLWLLAALRLLLPGMVGTSPISVMNTGLWKMGSAALTEEYDRQQNAVNRQAYLEHLGKIYEALMEEGAQGADLVQGAEENGSKGGITAGMEASLQIDAQSFSQTDENIDYISQYNNGETDGENRKEETETDIIIEEVELKNYSRETLFGKIRKWAVRLYLLGAAVCAAAFAWQNLSFYRCLKGCRRKIGEAAVGKKTLKIYAAGDRLYSPCLFGLMPAVYLPADGEEPEGEKLAFILEHELTHYRHRDHIWALVRILCLVTNWFNPLVWLAARLSVEDGELACDAGCLKRIGEEKRTAYGEALLAMISSAREKEALFTYAARMTSGKRFMKKRMENIAGNRKYHRLTALVIAVLVWFCAGCTFTGPQSAEGEESKIESNVANTAWDDAKASLSGLPGQEGQQTYENPEGQQAEPKEQPEALTEAAQAAGYYTRAVVLADEQLACKAFLSVTDPALGENWRKIVLLPGDLYLPDSEGGYAKLEELCRNCTAGELEQLLNRDLDCHINELELLSYEEFMEKIDKAGGIAVTIDERDISYLNQYLSAVTQEAADRIQIWESGAQTLHGMQAAAWLQIKSEIAGYDLWMDRWGQIVGELLSIEGISAVEICEDAFSQLDRSMYVETGEEETDYLLCFEWEKALRQVHELLYAELPYEPSSYVLAIDGVEPGQEDGVSMKELAGNAVKDSQRTAAGTFSLYLQYLGNSPYMISLLSGEEGETESEDAGSAVKVYRSGKELYLEEESGKAVYSVSLVFEEGGAVSSGEAADTEAVSEQRFLYLKKSGEQWYADGPLHMELPGEEWWQGA